MKNLISGILGKKTEGQGASVSDDVPDELPPLAEDIAAASEKKEPAKSVSSEAPSELPPLSATDPQPATSEHGTLDDLDSVDVPDAIKKAKLAKLKPEADQSAAQEPTTKQASSKEDHSVRERIEAGVEAGFFSNILEHLKRNQSARDKLLAGNLFLRMDNYWDLKKHEIKTGQQMPTEKKLESDLLNKISELRVLEQKWQVQKMALEEDLRYLHEREREIQAKISELNLLSNELALYRSVNPDDYFYLKDGVVLKNLHDLIDILEIIDDEAYQFHVRPNRNDFSEWVRNVFKDSNLADRLKLAKSKLEMIEILETIPVGMEQKERILKSAFDPRKYFWLSNGVVIRNIYELWDALKIMDEKLFAEHVHDKQNDFAKWVKEVLKNDILAQKLSETKSKAEMIQLIEPFL